MTEETQPSAGKPKASDTSASARDWVQRAVRSVGIVRAAEALAVGLGCGLGLWALCLVEGVAGAPRLAATCTGAGCALISWWIAHRPRAVALARHIDRVTGQGGQFVTAYQREVRAGSDASGIEALLTMRARSGLRWREVRSAVLPASLACAAAPFAGAALLAGALQVQRDDSGGGLRFLDLAQDVRAELTSARNAAYASGKLDDEAVEEISALVTAADETLSELEAGTAPEGEAQIREVQALHTKLNEVALEAQADPAVDAHLERAVGSLEALLSAGDTPEPNASDSLAQVPQAESTAAKPAASSGPPPSSALAGGAPGPSEGDTSGALDAGQSQGAGPGPGAGPGSGAGATDPPLGEQDPAVPVADASYAGLDWLATLPPELRDLALRWIELRASRQ